LPSLIRSAILVCCDVIFVKGQCKGIAVIVLLANMRAVRLGTAPRQSRFFLVRETIQGAATFKKKYKKLVKDTGLLEGVVSTVLGDGAQGLARKLHTDVATAATVELGYPYTLLLKVGINGTVNNLSNVTTDTALLLGETGAMNAAALVRHSKRDIADSGHKILVRLKISGAPLYSFFLSRQAKHVIFIKKLLSEGKKLSKKFIFNGTGGKCVLNIVRTYIELEKWPCTCYSPEQTNNDEHTGIQ